MNEAGYTLASSQRMNVIQDDGWMYEKQLHKCNRNYNILFKDNKYIVIKNELILFKKLPFKNDYKIQVR